MLAGFEVVRKLSDGASAEVFLAADPTTRDRMILEVIRPEIAAEPRAFELFMEATRARKELRHPSVVRRVAGGYTDDGRLYVRSEVVGENLRARLFNPGPLTLAQLVKMALPLCEAIHYLHERGLVHGNVKPESVFIKERGGEFVDVKLIDYGLALLRTPRRAPLPEETVLVEPEYLSPERAAGNRASIRCDIYALGVLFYEALTGFPPFTAADPITTRRMHLGQAMPALPPHCDRVAPIIQRCLSRDPAQRYGTAEAVRHALLALVDQTDGSTPTRPSPETFTPQSVGDLLGSWRLERILGEGAMGRVFLGRHMKLGRLAALKVLKPHLTADPGQVQRFFREARTVNQVSHPHIVQIHDFVDERSTDGSRHVFCVMELIDGKTLRQRMSDGPLTLEDSLRIARQVADALSVAHAVGVVHRDVKPDNILLTQQGTRLHAKVVDFGIAKLLDNQEVTVQEPVMAGTFEPTGTRAGMVVGTPAYMAPEQAMGQPVDERADVYALGVVLYRMLSSRLPFMAGDVSKLVREVIEQPAPPLPAVTTGGEPISPELSDLVMRCLAKKKEERPESMASVVQALDRQRAQIEFQRIESVRARYFEKAAETIVAQIRRPRWKPVAAGVGLLLLAVAVAALGLRLFQLARRAVPRVTAFVQAQQLPEEPLVAEKPVPTVSAVPLPAQQLPKEPVAAAKPVPTVRALPPHAQQLPKEPVAPAKPVPTVSALPPHALQLPKEPVAPAKPTPVRAEEVVKAPPPVIAAPPIPVRKVTLVVHSEPSGARVVREDTGEVLGTTPLRRKFPLQAGEVPLLFKIGGQPVGRVSVELSSDYTARVQLGPPQE